ncbi:uncharacterized protein PAE49_006951 [Odontesthes bonariensis]|uniref:uncharacterized protein LOC142382699 n=1 Tax=Odontesthes bonariensis TaxID=219752 RepID=UPI003F5843DD
MAIVQKKIVQTKIAQTKIAQTKIAQKKIVQTKIAQTKIVQTKIVQKKIAQTKIAQTKIAQTKIVQKKIVQTKIVQTKIAQKKIVQTKIVQTKIAQKKTVQTKTVQKKTVQKNTVQKNTVQKNTVQKKKIVLEEVGLEKVGVVMRTGPRPPSTLSSHVSVLNKNLLKCCQSISLLRTWEPPPPEQQHNSSETSVKMRLRPWMMLLVLLSGRRLTAVDVNRLTQVVRAIRTQYGSEGQFCLAANVPMNQDQGSLDRILQNNPRQAVLETLEKGDVYEGDSVIVAKPIKRQNQGENGDHAECRVLKELAKLNPPRNFLLVYSFLSPENIVTALNVSVSGWDDAAFVFTRVSDQPSDGNVVPVEDRSDSLSRLGDSMGGLSKVYRCYKENSELKCHSCSDQEGVAEVCLKNTSGQGGGSQQASSDQGDSGRRGSRRGSRGGSSSMRRDDITVSQLQLIDTSNKVWFPVSHHCSASCSLQRHLLTTPASDS